MYVINSWTGSGYYSMITGRQIGGYEIQEELGRGAMGVVFKARQISMDRIVAIKFLPKRLAQDERIVARFLREARAAGQLAHPNIVSVHELGMADGLHFIAMEYVDGNSIQKKIKDKGPFSEKETLEIALQIAEALKMAHSKGILHRDIKPDNFLIDSAGRVRLADLGLASIENKQTDGSLTQDGTTLGTPHFMAPEQCSGSGTDARSDLYSLGASMFVMCCGRTPYEGTTAAAVMVKVLTEKPASLKQFKPEISAGFVSLVEKLMNKDPGKRFQNATLTAEAIALCKAGNFKPIVTPTTHPAKPAGGTKVAISKSPPGAGAKLSETSNFNRVTRPGQSKLVPLMMGASAAVALIVFLAVFKSRGTPAATSGQPVIGKFEQPAVRGSIIETSGAPQPVAVKATDDSKLPEHERVKHRNPNSLDEQLDAIEMGLTSGKMKLAEAVRKTKEVRNVFQARIVARPGMVRRMDLHEKDLARRQESFSAEWKKLEPLIDTGVKSGDLKDVLTKLAQFKIDHEGLVESVKAGEKLDAITAEKLAEAQKLANGNNPAQAAALLKDLTEIKTLPEKNAESIKTAFDGFNERIKSSAELSSVYEQAWATVLKIDKLEKKNFQFAEAVRLCTESASKARHESNKKELLDLAQVFETARTIFVGMREQINAGNRLEMPNLPGFFKSKLKIVRWDDLEISFTPAEMTQPQPVSLYSASAPDAVLAIALELKKAALNSAAGQWEIGVLALALGNQNLATKYLREALAKDEALAAKPQAQVTAKLLKPVEPLAVKPPENENPAAAALLREKEAEQCLKDMQDAQKANDKTKLAALRVDMAAKFSDTEFFKSHKKEFNDLATSTVATVVPSVDPPKVPPAGKTDSRTAQEKEAHDALIKLGWPADGIHGHWTLTGNNIFKTDGIGELSFPALEADIDVIFQLMEPASKLRVLTRVIDKPNGDRYATFGTDKGSGFGADVSATNWYVYLDTNSRVPVLGGTFKVLNAKQHHLRMRHRDGKISVTLDDSQPKKSSGDARTTGDIRVIVNGTVQLVPRLINPAKQ